MKKPVNENSNVMGKYNSEEKVLESTTISIASVHSTPQHLTKKKDV